VDQPATRLHGDPLRVIWIEHFTHERVKTERLRGDELSDGFMGLAAAKG
jgi:hypothetical protein